MDSGEPYKGNNTWTKCVDEIFQTYALLNSRGELNKRITAPLPGRDILA